MSNETRPIKMRTANNRPQEMGMQFVHYGTQDFFKPQIIHCQAMNPGETVDLTTIVNIKGKPMMMMGEHQIKHILSAFWVPNFATHKDWFAFRTNLPFTMGGNYAKYEEDYYIYNTDLAKFFFQEDTQGSGDMTYMDIENAEWFEQQTVEPTQGNEWDVHMVMFEKAQDDTISATGTLCFNLTNKGRMLLNIIQQLGYNINWQLVYDSQENVDWKIGAGETYEDIETWITQFTPGNADPINNPNEIKLSARPLISFIKIMIDYYVPPQYENNYQRTFETALEYNYASLQYWGYLMTELISWINYDIDRFTGAWKNPTGPNDAMSAINIADQTNTLGPKTMAAQITENGVNYGPEISDYNNPGSGTYAITDYILRALDAIQNFTTRNRIAGYRPIDRFLAHFGKRLDYIHTKRSQYLDGNTNNLAIIDVTAMAETDGATAGKTGMFDSQLLGGQAAKVQGQNSINVKWTADDDGWIFIIDTIIPRPGYFQGLKNHCLRVNWMDLYNPEFDNLGTQPIRRAEIFHSAEAQSVLENDEQIWGYEPTYMGMKVGWDTKSGDRRVRTLNAGLEAMDTLRTFKEDGSNCPQSVGSNFLKGEQAQYDRIFQYIYDNVDHYYFTALTKDNGSKPMKSISESLPLTDGQGNEVQFQYGGGNYLQ